MNDNDNPYSPPVTQSDPIDSPASPVRRLLLEITHALFTIIGIMVGWGIIGAGLVVQSPMWLVVGAGVIGTACLLGLLIKVNPKGRLSRRL